jgi:hypothetical protein
MNLTLVELSLEGTLFWVVVLLEMAWAGFCFVNFIREYKNDLDRGGYYETYRSLLITGFLFIGMPVLQAEQWLYGSKVWAVGLVVLVIVLWVFTIRNALTEADRSGG